MTKVPATQGSTGACVALLGGCVFVAGLVSFLGWPLDARRLTDWFNDGVSIQPNASLLLTMSGAAVMLVERRAWRAVTALGALVAIAGTLILLQYTLVTDLGFNHQLLFGRTWGQNTTLSPGRVGPPASIAFIFIGCALLLLGSASRVPRGASLRRLAPKLGVLVCLFMMFSLLGFLFRAKEFYTIPWLTAIALPTASMLFALGLAIIFCVPEHDPMLLLSEDSGAGALGRFAVPTLLVMIPLLKWSRIQGYTRGYYDLGTGRALGALTLLVAVLSTLWLALTALRRREQALLATNERKDQFLATLAHELRNPLAPIRSGLEVIKLSPDEQEVRQDTLRTIESQVSHLTALVDDLLDVSRISAGILNLRSEHVALSNVIDDSLDLSMLAIAQRRHKLHIEQPEVVTTLVGDPHRLCQILSNLINNAAKYTPTGGNIWVSAKVENSEVVISIKDDGIGIAREDLERVFELFAQVDKLDSHGYGGLGIGLSLVDSLVKMHGGSISVTSEGKGAGSTFVVRLPTAERPPSSSAVASQAQSVGPQPAPCRKVLVVDDNTAAAKTLSIVIKKLGHEVRTAADGKAAFEATEEFQPELILMDIGMPVMDGYEAAKAIRAQRWGQGVALVALSGWGHEEDIKKAQAAGFDRHFVKPVDIDTVRALLFELPNVTKPVEGDSEIDL